MRKLVKMLEYFMFSLLILFRYTLYAHVDAIGLS